MKTVCKRILLALVVTMLLTFTAMPVLAADQPAPGQPGQEVQADATGSKAMAAGLAIGLAGGCGAIGCATGCCGCGAVAMGIAIAKSSDSIARQPEAEGKIRTSLMLGLVFIETVAIYALIVAILIVFVL